MSARSWHLTANVLFRLGNWLRDLADASWDREREARGRSLPSMFPPTRDTAYTDIWRGEE